jgi:hypothetical protein
MDKQRLQLDLADPKGLENNLEGALIVVVGCGEKELAEF